MSSGTLRSVIEYGLLLPLDPYMAVGRLAPLIATTHYIQQALLLYYAERGSVGDCLDFAGVHGHLYGHRLARRRVDVRAVALVDDAQRDGFVERYLRLGAWVQHSCTATRTIHDIHDTIYDTNSS